ncbi:peptidylprolyl isomerase [bacterium SCSIO 12741]|nr:peptidylprolyl isomerase [bacterium SCSIO 12741]
MKTRLLIAAILLGLGSAKAQTQVTLYTTLGDVVVEMYDTLTPITSGNFVQLAESKYYDGVIFHRVINNFMIQGGDPTGTGSGGPGYTIQDEFDSSLSNIQKTISMANRGPNTGGSQFFINLVNNTYLDFNKAPLTSKHAVFGIVVSGFNVVQDIGKVPTNAQDRPLSAVAMDSVRVTFDPDTVGSGGSGGGGGGGGVGVGIEQHSTAQLFEVFPNPISGQSFITIHTDLKASGELTLINQQGQILFGQKLSLSPGYQQVEIEGLNQVSNGMYYLYWKTGAEERHFPLVVNNH